MKKALIFALAALLTAGAAFTSYAYYTKTKSIPSVRVTINTGDLEIGDSMTDDAYSYVTVSNSNKYYELDDAEWIDDVTELKVGDAPRMQIYLSAIPYETESTNYTTIYIFSGSYTSSNVTVSKGSLLAADIRDSGYSLMLTVRIDPVKGTFDDPTSAYWGSTLGEAHWDVEFNTSGYYDLYLYKGSKTIKKLTNYNGTSYNFYPYMTEAGDYEFKVRAVADPEIGVGTSSGWTESSTLTIHSSEVSDGTGQTDSDSDGGTGVVSGSVDTVNGAYFGDSYGWISSGGSTYFRYPDGTLATGWLYLDGVYYRFDSYGKMVTGWYQNSYGKWFYMDKTTGAMTTGWLDINGTYYYLSTSSGDAEGEMSVGLTAIDGRYYYFDESGAMQTGWICIDDSYYYFYPEGSVEGQYGYMAVSTRVGDFTVGADGAWIS